MTKKVLHKALLRGVSWSAAIGLVAGAAFAQAQDGDDDRLVEEVVVTGSLIKKDNFDSASPLKVLDAVDIEAESTPAMGEIIYNQTFNYGSDAFASHYSVTNPEGNRTGANLRGLGGGATLTLLNGKRVLDANLNNLIPQIAVRRIDILKDGASALYGSDAVAGVLNIVPKTGYQGAEAGVQYQMDSRGDHSEQVANFILGDLTDNGYFTVALEYRQRTALYQTERPTCSATASRAPAPATPAPTTCPSGARTAPSSAAPARQTLAAASRKAPAATASARRSATTATTSPATWSAPPAASSSASSSTSSRPTRCSTPT